jgi:glycosyltransferase involved in cell wall biosynthesis
MRILLVTHDFLPNHPAGTEIYTFQLGRALQAAGHEVHVFTTEKDIARPNLEVQYREFEGLPVHELTNNLFYKDFRETWSYPPAERSFSVFLDDLQPDVVHFMHLMYLSVGCLEAVHRRGLPVFYTLHDYWLQCARFGQRVHADRSICHRIEFGRCGECMSQFKFRQTKLERRMAKVIARVHRETGLDLGPLARRTAARLRPPSLEARDELAVAGWEGQEPDVAEAAPPEAAAVEMRERIVERDAGLRSRVLPAVDQFIAPSEFLRDSFIDWGIPEDRIRYMRTGIDLEPFAGFRRSESRRLRVGFIGTVVPHKGLHVLLRAWGKLAPELRASADLLCYGPLEHTPGYVRTVRDLADNVGVELLGKLAAREVAGALSHLDLLVVPSVWYENSPLIILEAKATRTPLLVSDLGGMAELVEPGVSGYRFPVGDSTGLADVLTECLRDPGRLAALYPSEYHVRAVEEDARDLLELYGEARAKGVANP